MAVNKREGLAQVSPTASSGTDSQLDMPDTPNGGGRISPRIHLPGGHSKPVSPSMLSARLGADLFYGRA